MKFFPFFPHFLRKEFGSSNPDRLSNGHHQKSDHSHCGGAKRKPHCRARSAEESKRNNRDEEEEEEEDVSMMQSSI